MRTMGMGAYDEDEHERRVQKSQIDAEFDDDRSEYKGTLTYESGDSTEALLDRFQELKDEE